MKKYLFFIFFLLVYNVNAQVDDSDEKVSVSKNKIEIPGYIKLDFGIFPLKYFFSESTIKKNNELISSKIVKNSLKKIIKEEDKTEPYSDEKLEKILNQKGYEVARRTVSKYREQLKIPVARLRKEF